MAVTSGFYDSETSSPRMYTAEEFGSIFDGLISDGVYQWYGQKFAVTKASENSLNVNVGTGRGWFKHTWILNDSLMQITVRQPHTTYSRVDVIAIKVNKQARTNTIEYYYGKEDGSNDTNLPADDTINNIYYYPIASITVPANATSASAYTIKSMIGVDGSPTKWVYTIIENALDISTYLQDYQTQVANQLAIKFAEIDQWRQTISALLDGDVAANLSNAINQTNEDLASLKTKHDNDMTSMDARVQGVVDDNATLHQADTAMNATLTNLSRHFSNGLTVYSGTSYNINEAPETFCRILNTCKGTLPTGLGGNQYSVYTQVPGKQTNPAYNVQVAVGFGSDKIAIRRRNGSSWTAWKYVNLT